MNTDTVTVRSSHPELQKVHVTFAGSSLSCGLASPDAALGHFPPNDEHAEHIVFPAPEGWEDMPPWRLADIGLSWLERHLAPPPERKLTPADEARLAAAQAKRQRRAARRAA